MRLLSLNSDGSFCLTTFIGNKIPRYGILSHTWDAYDQEVTLQDLMDTMETSNGGCERVMTKTGYKKIRFCGEQAQSDGLKYFWVDSCCIDKTSSAELSEAINSMFKWYRRAAKCYVYLSDVPADYRSQLRGQPMFRQSRWFTRGWTLQELLAPRTVEFFSYDGEKLGDKKSLEKEIYDATGIADQALQGMPLSQFSLNQRISWMVNRETTVEEDFAYCLLGILNIHVPLIYGEGVENAFIRLLDEITKRLSIDGLQKGRFCPVVNYKLQN